MPPFLPRKRSAKPPSTQRPPSAKRARLTDVLDADATNRNSGLKSQRSFNVEDQSDSTSDLSEIDSDEFEDISTSKNGIGSDKGQRHLPNPSEDEDDGHEDEDDIEWEDAPNVKTAHKDPGPAWANGSIELTFRKDDDADGYSAAIQRAKKGPTRREKYARLNAHRLHVQFLLWHNAIRNSWIGDKQVQEILVKQLPQQLLAEVKKWKRASGLLPPEPPTKEGKDRKKNKRKQETKRHRDWGSTSQPLENGKPDMSHGDPLISLMKVLAAYWKKRFAITAPGLRKRGYGTKQALKHEIQSYRNDEHDVERHGEKIVNLDHFRKLAQSCEGSRDLGAQLFTALIRGLGLEARMVASLQPTGYGWTKAEQKLSAKPPLTATKTPDGDSGAKRGSKTLSRMSAMDRERSKRQGKGKKTSVVNLDSDADAIDGNSTSDEEDQDTDNDDDGNSVIDVTVTMPKQKTPKYDRELAFPIYWTEVVSPITNKILAVSPLVIENAVASTPETLSQFEPRGSKAEKAHQVMAYVIAHSSDGTAKDVTVRYLRKRLWPGKTKGFRFPTEKVPIYDERGKVRRYEEFDWFKFVMRLYTRSSNMRTAVDDIEDTLDLTPAQPDKKDETGVDTLQSLKSSTDYTLERFLRREEALKPTAKPVRMFVSGKGEQMKEEPVYRRADVERCLTAESWHKEGRRPKLGETPMKLVPVRAVTLTRKREAEEHQRVTGEKQMQGLYAWDQTEWIIPAPIENGVIPKNSYGNMDCFVPSMVPQGAVHVPLKGTVKLCKKLGIDYAEAVTGFEFGNKRAVPVCTGVVVATENKDIVLSAWKAYNEEQKRKEDQKLEQLVLDTWKKFVIGLRIRERIVEQYGDGLKVDEQATGLHKEDPIAIDDDDGQNTVPEAGGFLPDDENDQSGGGFLLAHEDDMSDQGELVVEHEPERRFLDGTDNSMHLSDTSPALDSTNKDDGKNNDSEDLSRHQQSFAPKSNKKKEKGGRKQAKVQDVPPLKPNTTTKTKSGKSKRSEMDIDDTDNMSDLKQDNDSLEDKDERRSLSSNNGEDDNKDDMAIDHHDASDSEQEETYTPRTTRRPRKAILSKPFEPQPSAISSPEATSALKSTTHKTKMKNEDDDAVAPTMKEKSRRGRPRRNTTTVSTPPSKKPAHQGNEKDTRSSGKAKAKKNKSTSLTSPYFGSSD